MVALIQGFAASRRIAPPKKMGEAWRRSREAAPCEERKIAMREFTSYGSPDRDIHYHAPREKLIENAYRQLIGNNPEKGGHYITVWAPRQTGKSWAMLEVIKKIQQADEFDVGYITMQSAKEEKTDEGVLNVFVSELRYWFEIDLPDVQSWKHLQDLFTRTYFSKPLILIVDEFDAIRNEFINKFANEFRKMYTLMSSASRKKTDRENYMLHGLALIGVRSVLGIGNVTGSPFNVQRSLHIQNLSLDEVRGIFQWYQKESGRKIESEVIDRLYNETLGQPGLTCWLGGLLAKMHDNTPNRPFSMEMFEEMYLEASDVLPNINILNLLSKIQPEPYRELVLEIFKTEKKFRFKFENTELNYLYMNGVIDVEKATHGHYVKFASPFVQKKIFNNLSDKLFDYTGNLFDPFEDLSDTITDEYVNIKNLLRRYQTWLKENRRWLLEDAPRRKDLRIFEAVYHFNLYRYLCDFLEYGRGRVWPEFPTGNGKIDLIVEYKGRTYGIEVKSFSGEFAYREALDQAAEYGDQLGLSEITLVFFVEVVDDASRGKYEKDHVNEEYGVKVVPVFVETGGIVA